MALTCLIIQLITGILLVMYYCANVALAFDSVAYIMREVSNGWILRFIHANTVSLFFASVFAHMMRGLYHKSYKFRVNAWRTGVVIFLLLMGTAFIGYVLPWGQMSFWGATVITNLVTAIPVLGQHIAYWVWGGFAVDNATLNRFFSLHYLLPFIVLGVTFLHLFYLHVSGSSTPMGTRFNIFNIYMHPYFTAKDAITSIALIFVILYLSCLAPDYLGHADNYIPADPLVTPKHIVPEWYFLPFYAILRACPSKWGGVIGMLGAILVLVLLPSLDGSVTSTPLTIASSEFLSTSLAVTLSTLDTVGGLPASTPFIWCAKINAVFYWFAILGTSLVI
jgi:ubiquinol-cytochrome c reductase cytochrome b/c1 subunit